mgnify:CR=1 FL=1
MSLKISIRDIGVWLGFAVLLFFSGFRWDVGVDFMAYYNLYGENWLANAFLLDRIEWGNIGLKYILFISGFDDGRYWIWAMAFITLFFVFYSISHYAKHVLFPMVLFICLGYFFYTLNGIRQYCAVSITMFAWQFLMKDKFLKYFIVIFCASLFHKSALIMLPFYLIRKRVLQKNTWIVLFCICLPMAFVASYVVPHIMSLFPSYSVYEDMSFSEASGNMLSYARLIFPITLFVLTMMVYDKLMEKENDRVIVNLALCAMLWMIVFPNTPLMVRISYYFQFSFLFFIPLLCRTLAWKNGRLVALYVILFNLLFISIILFSRPAAKIVPFQLDFSIFGLGLCKISLVLWIVLLLFIRVLGVSGSKQLQV